MRRTDWSIAAVLCSVYAALAYRFWFVCDDSYITFRFSRHLAAGHGIRYNLGDHEPVEGYSNFLWMMIAAAVEALGGAPDFYMPLLSLVLAVGFLAYFYRVARTDLRLSTAASTVATAGLVFSPSFEVWATSGLATMPYAVALFVLVERLILARSRSWWQAAVAAVVVALIGTEGIAWVMTISGVAVVTRFLAGERRRGPYLEVAKMLAAVLGIYGLYFAWRLAYFGEWLSNTAYAKVGMSTERVLRGVDYVVIYALTYIAPALWLLGAPFAIREDRERGLAVTLLALGFPAYAVLVGGDYMTSGRFLVPALPFLALLFGWGAAWLWSRTPAVGARLTLAAAAVAMLGVGFVPAFDKHVVPQSVRERFDVRLQARKFHTEYWFWDRMRLNSEAWKRRGMALDQVTGPDDSLPITTIGAIGYHAPNLHIYDLHGLVNKEVAHREVDLEHLEHNPGHDKEVPRNYFLDREPTVLEARLLACPRERFLEDSEVVPGLGWTCSRGRARREIRKSVKQWTRGPQYTREVHENYVPDLARVQVPGYRNGLMLTLRRLEEGESRVLALEDFEQAVQDFSNL